MEAWEKELRHKRKLDTLIINRPEALKTLRRRIEFSLTTLGWAVWIFLCRPILMLILWLASFRVLFRHMVDLGGFMGLLELKMFYISAIALIIILIRGWNVYNKARYSKKTRRKSVQPVSDKKLEKYFKLPEGSAGRLQSMNEISVDFMDDHQLKINNSTQSCDGFKGYFKSS